MGIVRHNRQVMTEIKYKELEQAYKEAAAPKLSIMAKANLFFFDVEEISLGDWCWFYGTMIYMVLVTILTFILTV